MIERADGPIRVKARKGKPSTRTPDEVERFVTTGEKLGRIPPTSE